MEIKNYNAYFFILVLIGISVFAFFIIEPFLMAIVIASVLAVIFQRPYRFFLSITRGRESLSAFLTALFGSLLMVALLAIFSSLIVNELTGLYKSTDLGSGSYQYINNALRVLNENDFIRAIGGGELISKDAVTSVISQSTNWVVALAQAIYQGMAGGMFLLIVSFFSLYYFLIGGKGLVEKIMYLSPLKDSHEKLLIDKFVSISRATMKGALVVSFIQGSIGGIIFAIAGIPSATIWAVLMMIFSLVPMIGSSIIWFPAGIIMLILGNVWQGIFILAVGLGFISVIDNFLRPKLVGKDTQMHPLIVFFATLGGISLFGFFGFIIGPLVVALFLTLWDIYAIEFKKNLKKYNA